MIGDGIPPRLIPELEILPWRRTHVLAVQAYPSPRRPYFLKRAGPDGGVHVRVGSTNRSGRIDGLVDSARILRTMAIRPIGLVS